MVACHKLINYDTTILACKENSPFTYQRTGFSSEFYSTCTPPNHLDLMVCPLFFFQNYWHIVGSNVTNAVLSVLLSGHMLHKINYTHIVLIPKKKKDPKNVVGYCPIVSKVLANQLKLTLPNVISNSKSVFVPHWLMTNNITVAF